MWPSAGKPVATLPADHACGTAPITERMAAGRDAGGGRAPIRMATGREAGGDLRRSWMSAWRAVRDDCSRHADSVRAMATQAPSESTPQRLAAIREQLKLLADYL